MMKLSDFLHSRFAGRGNQAKFARKTGISDGTVSKWATEDLERAPNFENCLRIADYFGVNPEEIFGLADRLDYIELYRRFFPESQERKIGNEEENLSPYLCPKHKDYHRMLEEILHAPGKWSAGMLVNIESLWSTATGNPLPLSEKKEMHSRTEAIKETKSQKA
jgi:transcriptional regulator with XRE-family HTH domain